jgi:hypothetical protein
MTNRDLLKEAIADARTVKETAITNAKAALEEAFVPFLREKLALKLEEMDSDENNELPKMKKKEVEENYESENMKSSKKNEMEEEMNLEELLRELDGLEEDKTINATDWEDYNEDKENDNHGNLNEAEDEDADGVPDDLDADINLGDMSKEEQEIYITNVVTDVINDMVKSGEIEAGHEGEEDEEEEEESEEEFSINELLAEMKKVKTKKTAKKVVKSKSKEDEEKDEESMKMKKDLKEAYDALRTIKSELNEVNLFNAKLLYTNKIFRSKNLSENQKVKVLAAFDKAVSIKEAKLVYETLNEGLKTTKTTVNESLLRGAASKASGIAPKKPILEVNNQFARMQKLAGIIK